MQSDFGRSSCFNFVFNFFFIVIIFNDLSSIIFIQMLSVLVMYRPQTCMHTMHCIDYLLASPMAVCVLFFVGFRGFVFSQFFGGLARGVFLHFAIDLFACCHFRSFSVGRGCSKSRFVVTVFID